MGRYLFRVMRALLVSSLGVGGGFGLLFMIFVLTNKSDPNAFRYGMTAGLLFGLIFALFMIAVLLPLDLSAHIFLSKGSYRQIWELEQVREFEVSGTAKQILHFARQALLVVPYVVEVSDDLENMVTRAKSGTSWRSGGELMEVEINPLSSTTWKIKVSSRPSNKKLVFDYGKNFENVETFVSHFNNLARVESSGSSKTG